MYECCSPIWWMNPQSESLIERIWESNWPFPPFLSQILHQVGVIWRCGWALITQWSGLAWASFSPSAGEDPVATTGLENPHSPRGMTWVCQEGKSIKQVSQEDHLGKGKGYRGTVAFWKLGKWKKLGTDLGNDLLELKDRSCRRLLCLETLICRAPPPWAWLLPQGEETTLPRTLEASKFICTLGPPFCLRTKPMSLWTGGRQPFLLLRFSSTLGRLHSQNTTPRIHTEFMVLLVVLLVKLFLIWKLKIPSQRRLALRNQKCFHFQMIVQLSFFFFFLMSN